MVDNPLPGTGEILGTAGVFLGVPLALVITLLVLSQIAQYVRDGQTAVRVTRTVAQQLGTGYAEIVGSRIGQLRLLAVSQAAAILATYTATRWLMFFPRSPWAGETTDWTDRIAYFFALPPSPSAPELVVAAVALGVTLVMSYCSVFQQALPFGVSSALAHLASWAAGLVGFVIGAAGLIGIGFFSLTIGSLTGGTNGRTAEYNAGELPDALTARDSAAVLLFTGIVLVAACYIILWFISCAERVNGQDTSNTSITGK